MFSVKGVKLFHTFHSISYVVFDTLPLCRGRLKEKNREIQYPVIYIMVSALIYTATNNDEWKNSAAVWSRGPTELLICFGRSVFSACIQFQGRKSALVSHFQQGKLNSTVLLFSDNGSMQE